MSQSLAEINKTFANATPQEIIEWAVKQDGKIIVTTNFRPQEAVILHMAVQAKPDIEVLWVDSGYNLANTYRFADKVIEQLGLNISVYAPKVTAARRDAVMDGIPMVDDPAHELFTEQFKLEPFRRAMNEIKPDLWLTAVRREQTEFRQNMEYVSETASGALKVAPLLDWTDAQMQAYLAEHNLPDEQKYFDPTKAEANRECGLHTQL
ncbi:phosphoadenosine phosphosulfate reductase domain-containing protein [Salinibius halmophilus]|uniref:phosphoadenosine phosphosulfate reductase domain-containing protein n=1 Tax=Salinibius halmophilus TaxID=1853216 RepID=UPI000E66E821|nr:phosphoadenosine phosphosulfate reductase family protein [Salinibius halmophilus]